MKKFFITSLAILLLSSLAIVGASAADLSGDVNGDGKVDIRDAASILLYVSGKPVECISNIIDTNGDGVIDQNDAENILKNITGHADADLNMGTACSHQLKKIDAVPATYGTEGSIEHWICSVCSGIFKDESAKTLITAAATVIPALPASEGLTFELDNNGTGYTVTGIGTCTDTELIIPATYKGLPVTSIYYFAFYNCRALTSVSFGNYIESIRSEAFSGCSGLVSITLPESVKTIDMKAFENCSSLKSVTIPDSVTSIGSEAFSSCRALETVSIGNNVTSIGGMAFVFCSKLKSINIPDSVEDIGGGAFYGCSSLTAITIPEKVTSIRDTAFAYCSSLRTVFIGNGVTVIESAAFRSCNMLLNFIFDGTKEDWEKVNKGENWNLYCPFTEVTFTKTEESLDYSLNSDGQSYTVTGIGTCRDTEFAIPATYKGLPVTAIAPQAFAGNETIVSVVIPDSITSLGAEIFEGCTSLVDCFFDGNAKEWFAVNRDQFWFNSKTSEGYYIQGGRMWEDTNVILLKPEYSFTLNEDKSSYTWNGSGGFRNIVFSSTYNGLPVTNFKLFDAYGQSIRKVYFEGTPEEWAAIEMSGDTYIIDRAVIYYYSLKEPTTCGNFWHFVDGLPVAWGEEGRGHTVVTSPAVPATCTEDGLTEGKVCSECGFVIAYQNTVYSKGHQNVSENGKAATARTFGYTKYEYCTVCLTVTSERELILPTGIADPAYYASRYGYDYLGTLEKGEAMQAFYKALDREAAKFHLNGETVNNEYNYLPLINFTELGLTENEAISVYVVYKNDHPLYYWISNTWVTSSTSLGLTVMDEYVDGETRTETNEFVYAALAEYLKIVMNETSEYQIAFGLYDAIVANASYAYEADGRTPVEADWAHSIIGILEQNAGVCESYAELFHALLNFSGVDSILVHGLGNGGGHAWNLVKLDDGEWYWYDPTWGELCWEIYSISHTSFCLTDTQDPTAEIGFWTFYGDPFTESHKPYSHEVFGSKYCYELPERSETVFDTDDTQLYDTFTYGELEYIVIGYDTVFCNLPRNSNITPPETLNYRGREYKVVFYEY